MNLQPVIKWSGSKRSQAKKICYYIVKNYDTYFQPFCGGCSMLYYILNNTPNQFKNYICSDLNDGLIGVLNKVKNKPQQLISSYTFMWNQLNKDDDLQRKKQYFNKIRFFYNENHNSDLFFFIMRTTTNGMPRYNKNGQFNNSFHFSRKGIIPQRMQKIIYKWKFLLNKYNVQFINQSYENIEVKQNDFIYLDPPYANTKAMYYGSIEYNKLWEFLKNINCDYAMSFDGVAGQNSYVYNVPEELYNKHILIDSGNSSFRRVIGNDRNCDVKQSLYLKIKEY